MIAGIDERAAEVAGAVEAARVCFNQPLTRAVFSASAVWTQARKSVPTRFAVAYLEAYFQQVWREVSRQSNGSPGILLYLRDADAQPVRIEYLLVRPKRVNKTNPAAPAGWSVYRTRVRYPSIADLIVAQVAKQEAA